jgi:predicted O-methyltransferase YrrM
LEGLEGSARIVGGRSGAISDALDRRKRRAIRRRGVFCAAASPDEESQQEGIVPKTETNARCSLRDPRVRAVLDRLHRAARGDWWRFIPLAPKVAFGFLRGKTFAETVKPDAMKNCAISVSRDQGRFLYLTARALGAKRIVEFGTSFGISSIYLAAAVRDNGGEIMIGTELEPSKHARAVANIEEAGLGALVEVRLGDALETLSEVPEPLDLVFMDGWKDLYLPVLELLRPRLRPGSVVLSDNIFTFKKALRPYVEYLQSGENGFESMTLPIADGTEYSCFVG